ncbi:hypothetical protein IG631_19740 [Alternaria alternata]|nr:hypothetical protein IG631_19740 [Alternaria alternata]
MKTPEQLGRNVGDVLRSYPADSTYEPFSIKHLAGPGADIMCRVGCTEIQVGLSLVYMLEAGGALIYRSKGGIQLCSSSNNFLQIDESFWGKSKGWGCDSDKDSSTHDTNRELEIGNVRDIRAMGLAAGGKLSRAS